MIAVERIPAELRARAQWVVWAYERDSRGRPTKVPRQAREPSRLASSTEPRTWASFTEARQAFELAGPTLDGIGFALAPDDPYVALDLDLCVDRDGRMHPEARRIVRTLGSYCELSPSRLGVRVFVAAERRGTRNETRVVPWAGHVAEDGRTAEFAAYSESRYLTLTGAALNGAPRAVERRQAELDAVLAELLPEPSRNGARAEAPPDIPLSDERLLEIAFGAENGARLRELWAGGEAEGERSEGDLALASLLGFYFPTVDRLAAVLQRSRRERLHERRHAERDEAKALAGRTEFFGDRHDEQDSEPEQPEAEPFALWLDEFVEARSEQPEALIGEGDDVLLPAAGFLILGGRGGKGKTTLAVDCAFHLASGRDWLGFKVPRPLRMLMVENEGPQEMFRRKVEAKRASWPHKLTGGLAIQTAAWGGFDLRDETLRRRLREFVETHAIDLVIADPLDSTGLEGAGSPEDTRRFMDLAKQAGLHRDVAFMFLHHPRKERADDELDELAGAWGGRPDTVLMLSLLAGERSRLAMPKVRWSRRGARPALILAFDPDGETFECVAEEGEERDYTAEIETLLGDGEWRTVEEILRKDGGIGAGREHVKQTLAEGHPERFAQRRGDELGRSPRATVWSLTRLA